jgi:hypothetical protein
MLICSCAVRTRTRAHISIRLRSCALHTHDSHTTTPARTCTVDAQRKYDLLLEPAMTVEVPESDTRQVDMATAALLATTNNYVGNQPNYGNGATYWSYGREDNGSLPLNMLAVDDALLGWGVCGTALDHIGE